MIYLFSGDYSKASLQAKKTLAVLKQKRPSAEVFVLDEENFNTETADRLLLSVGLFESKHIIVGRRLSEIPEAETWLSKNVKKIESAEHIFLLVEEKISKALLTKLEKNGSHIKIFDSQSKKETLKDNFIFTIGDALGERNRQKMWLVFTKAKLKGLSDEDIFWQLVGMVKNILLVNSSPGDQKVPLHPFVIQKVRKFSRNFSQQELADLFSKLFNLYHGCRRKNQDLGVALERLVLEI